MGCRSAISLRFRPLPQVSLLQQASHYLILSKRAQIRSEIRARSAVEGKKKQ